jgi:creatinine amidohydrolase
VDVVIAEEVCRRTAERLRTQGMRAVIFPPITYGLTDFAASFSGTISIEAQTVQRYLEQVLAGIASHGFSVIGVVNHHVEPAHFKVVHEAARSAAEKTRARIVVPDHRRRPLVEKLGQEFVSGGSHAGLYETSLMLAAAPGLVREDIRARLPALDIDLPGRIKAGARDFHECGGHDAYFGDPSSASAEEGVRLLELLAGFTAQALQAP